MKSKFVIIGALAICVFLACNKSDRNETKPAKNSAQGGGGSLASAKPTGDNYSRTIKIDTANRMIGSYLASVGYPEQDSALRGLYFDADSLRSYLSDPKVVTIKLVFAHQQSHITASTYGKYVGLKPGSATIIIAGLDDNNNLVPNNKGGVYEHALPCPTSCSDALSAADGLLH